MRNRTPVDVAVLRRLMSAARYEVLPTDTIEDKVLAHVPTEQVLTITASPAKGLDATLDLAERLAKQGYQVVPHLAARMVRDRVELSEICDRLLTAGIRTVFVPAGDKTPPEGVYDAALPMLADLTDLGQPFPEVGITGYPETHPLISDDVTIQSMWDKRPYATHIVSNLVFDPAAVDSWLVRMRARGITLPVFLGVPGPTELTKLVTMATKIGVGDSTRFLMKHKGAMFRLATPGGFTGERFLEQCSASLARADAGIAGLHVYTFNQVEQTEKWRRDFVERFGTTG